MTTLIPFNRRRNEVDNLGNDTFYNMLDDFFSDNWFPGRGIQSGTFKLDVKESDTAYTIEAELPGISKDEIELDLNRERLTISVNKEEVKEEDNERYVHRERRLSSMSRSIHLGDAELGEIKAKLDNGILTINVPKKVKANESTKISID